jgi:hypothetical protein
MPPRICGRQRTARRDWPRRTTVACRRVSPKQSFNVGDRWNGNYRPWTFDQVPLDWRNQYNLDPRNRYYYRDGYLYSVDPQTRLVESVIQALIH